MFSTNWGTSFTTTVRMVVRVHYNTSDSRTDAHVSFSAGFTDCDVAVLAVADRAYGSAAINENHADFA